jgi:hypothetical protein
MLVGATLSGAAQAGSYMRSGGDLSYSSSVGYTWATREWNADSELQDISCRREHQSNSHYLEYGYSYYHTLFGGASLGHTSCGSESTSGFGDLRAGIRGRTSIYENHRTWELVATVPVSRSDDSPRLGCGALGLSGALARKDDLTDTLALGSGVGLQFWEGPLAHEVEADVSLSGPLPLGRLRWNVELGGRAPLEGGGEVATDISDCGTRGKAVKAGLRLGTSVSRDFYVSCSYSRSVWGEEATLSQGFSCGFSRSWD